jgi:hypothetical protein
MKRYLWLSVLLILRSVLLAENQPAVEAFGIKLGETTDGLVLKATEDSTVFQIKPPLPNAMLTNYMITVTPKSGKVREVSCRLRSDNKQTMLDLLTQKYGEPQGTFGEIGTRDVKIKFSNSYERTFPEFDVVLSYTMQKLGVLSQIEEAQIKSGEARSMGWPPESITALLADGQPPIEAFGIKLRDTTNGLALKPTEDPTVFEVIPPAPHEMITNYTVKVTPKSGRVAQVCCRLRESDMGIAFALLKSKYNAEGTELSRGDLLIDVQAGNYSPAYPDFSAVFRFQMNNLITLCNIEKAQIDAEDAEAGALSSMPITGVFGITLGQLTNGLELAAVRMLPQGVSEGKVRATGASQDTFYLHGQTAYRINPLAPDPRFTNCVVTLTPISKRVHAISAQYGKLDEQTIWRELLKKHGKKNQVDSYKLKTGGRSVLLYRREGSDTGTIYYSGFGEQLQKEMDQFDEEQRQQNLKQTDKTGL